MILKFWLKDLNFELVWRSIKSNTHVVFDLNGCSIATLVLIRRLILVVQVSIVLIGRRY